MLLTKEVEVGLGGNNIKYYEELRFDVDNGVCMCFECHDMRVKNSFPNIYTQFNNTREQLEEYIKNKNYGGDDNVNLSEFVFIT